MKKQKLEKLKNADLHNLINEFLKTQKILSSRDNLELHEISFGTSTPAADGRICVEWEQITETIQTSSGPVTTFKRGVCLKWAKI